MAVAHKTVTENSFVVQLVQDLIKKAVQQGASDIHLESMETGLRVRYRLDGMLYDQEKIGMSYAQQVVSRLKVLANLDITEKRIPLDGKFQIQLGRQPIDLRISTFPALHGEKLVIRILDRSRIGIKLEHLGFSPTMLSTFKNLLHCSSGFFLVAGPTGSGKTTTLYGALAELHSQHKNIITLEDPVEYNVDGVTQGQINNDVGFSFEKGMRALLRQDPDIIMIGEIRDKQTAHIAIQAALTGHVVLSTIHTNDAPSVIMRLMDMGIEPYLINAALTGVLAQRLARKICGACRVAVIPTHAEQVALEGLGATIDTLYKGQGCEQCFNVGYKGRIGIFELLPVTDELRSCIAGNPSLDSVRSQQNSEAFVSLRAEGIEKMRQGIITLDELTRVFL